VDVGDDAEFYVRAIAAEKPGGVGDHSASLHGAERSAAYEPSAGNIHIDSLLSCSSEIV
jgi:hypothetical protein